MCSECDSTAAMLPHSQPVTRISYVGLSCDTVRLEIVRRTDHSMYSQCSPALSAFAQSQVTRVRPLQIASKRSRPAAVTVEYSARGGLFNQHMSNEAAFMLAAALRARRIRWPPARNRDTFDVRYRDSKWTPINASELYDVELMKTFAARKSAPLSSNCIRKTRGQ